MPLSASGARLTVVSLASLPRRMSDAATPRSFAAAFSSSAVSDYCGSACASRARSTPAPCQKSVYAAGATRRAADLIVPGAAAARLSPASSSIGLNTGLPKPIIGIFTGPAEFRDPRGQRGRLIFLRK